MHYFQEDNIIEQGESKTNNVRKTGKNRHKYSKYHTKKARNSAVLYFCIFVFTDGLGFLIPPAAITQYFNEGINVRDADYNNNQSISSE